MTAALWSYLGTGFFVLVFTYLLSRWARSQPNKDKNLKHALRQPKAIAVIGWLVLLIGLVLFLFSPSNALEANDHLPMLICGIILFVAGAFLVTIYANWYVIIGTEKIVQRTAFRHVLSIEYTNIKTYLHYQRGGVPMFKLWSNDGVVIELNSKAFDISPIVAALKNSHASGL